MKTRYQNYKCKNCGKEWGDYEYDLLASHPFDGYPKESILGRMRDEELRKMINHEYLSIGFRKCPNCGAGYKSIKTI